MVDNNERANKIQLRRSRALKLFQIITFIVFFVGIYFLFHLCLNARKIYFSENALNVGLAENNYNFKEHEASLSFTEEYRAHQNGLSSKKMSKDEAANSIAGWITGYSEKIGFETYSQPFYCKKLDRNFTNIVSIVRSKSCGKESMAISTTYEILTPQQLQQKDAVSSIGTSFSLLKMIGNSGWLARDFFMITTYSECKEEGIESFLSKYYEIKLDDNYDQEEFSRGGKIQNAIHVEFYSPGFDQLNIESEGMQLPNLDLVNTVAYTATNERLQHIQYYKEEKLSPLLSFLPKFKFNTLIEFIFNCALGVPTNSHSSFNKFNIDAVSLSVKQNMQNYSPSSLVHLGRTLEGSFRCLNNLLEHLHQSFYFYLLPSVGKYIPIGDYMICFALMFPVFFINALAIYFGNERKEMTKAVSFFVLTEIVCLSIFLLPFFLQKQYSGEELWKITFYASLSLIFVLFIVVYPVVEYFTRSFLNTKKDVSEANKPDKGIKVVCSMFGCLFIACMALVNFSFSFLASLLIIPVYYLLTATNYKFFNAIQMLVLTISSPFSLLYFASPLLNSNFYQVLDIIFQQYKIYSNFVYPFVWLVYLPINLLYIKMMIQ